MIQSSLTEWLSGSNIIHGYMDIDVGIMLTRVKVVCFRGIIYLVPM